MCGIEGIFHQVKVNVEHRKTATFSGFGGGTIGTFHVA